MVATTIFFWLLPVMYALFAGVFIAIAQAEGTQRCARKGAAAFAIAVLAIILDTQRSYFPSWFFTMAVPLHWLVLIFTADAFLARYGVRTPRKPATALFAVGLAINLWATFVVDQVDIRVPNASVVCILMLTLALPLFFRRNMKMLEKLTAGAFAATWLSYIIRFGFYFGLDQSPEYAEGSLWSQYMMMFYFTSAITTLALATLLILTITADIVAHHHAATTIDPLTGIANRRGYEQMTEPQSSGAPPIVAVMMIDLDRFKAINDTYGHAAGDAVLIATASALANACQRFGEVARMGGEEFAVLVYHPHRRATGQFAQLLRSAVGCIRLDAPLHELSFTASIGVALLDAGESISEAMRRADMALYKAKNDGRNRVEIAPEITETSGALVAA
jgi:diguanylate cyclase (GGDEF)-like protein